jgi:hypothetical protein
MDADRALDVIRLAGAKSPFLGIGDLLDVSVSWVRCAAAVASRAVVVTADGIAAVVPAKLTGPAEK